MHRRFSLWIKKSYLTIVGICKDILRIDETKAFGLKTLVLDLVSIEWESIGTIGLLWEGARDGSWGKKERSGTKFWGVMESREIKGIEEVHLKYQ